MTFCLLLMFSLVPVRLRKILRYWEIYNLARNIQMELTIHFTPYNKVHTNLALFFYLWIWESQYIRYANFWRYHGRRSLRRAYVLFSYSHLRLKMMFKLYLCGHKAQATLSLLSVNRNSFASSSFIKHFNFIRSK